MIARIAARLAWIGPLLLLALVAPVCVGQTVQTAKPAVQVIVDTKAAPDLAAWADHARELVEEWHPKIAELLASKGFRPPETVRLVFRKDEKGVASTQGTVISISAYFVRRHPEDVGMVIHELVHVIQAYPKYEHVWLIEGIADYVRFFHFEPETKLPPIDPAKASYRDGYKTTARFLAWVAEQHDAQLVSKLNAALRQSRYNDDLFEKYTGRPLAQLWTDFLQATTKPRNDTQR